MGFSSWGKSADAKDSVSRTIPSREFHSRIRYSSIRNKVIHLSADNDSPSKKNQNQAYSPSFGIVHNMTAAKGYMNWTEYFDD